MMGDLTDNRVVAQYDFRTKQKYIFRTDKLREIVGASALITCMYDLFIGALAARGIKVEKNYEFPGEVKSDLGWGYRVSRFIDLKYENSADKPFDPNFDGCDFDGKVLYVGGGNLYILWRGPDTAKRANGILCELLRQEGYSLFPACGMTPYTGEYPADIRRLSAAFNRSKEELPPFEPMAVLPIVRFHRKTSFPIAHKVSEHGVDEYLPRECVLKRMVSDRRIAVTGQDPLNVRELDKMTDKGTDSLLAVIHIDGNNMGERVSALMNTGDGAQRDYPAAVRKIRAFSNEIQESYVTALLTAIAEWLTERQLSARIIVAGGDDVTLVCRARYARDLLKVYFDRLRQSNAGRDPRDWNTACAGVCIFHSHSPFATAYEIAEDCCEEAKKINRKNGGNNMLMDFQYCFSGVTGDLKDIRGADAHLMGRPYSFNAEDIPQPRPILPFGALEKMDETLRSVGREDSSGQRSVLKRLSALLLMRRDTEFALELKRLEMSYQGFRAPREEELPEFKKLVFDLAQVYDLWFAQGEAASR